MIAAAVIGGTFEVQNVCKDRGQPCAPVIEITADQTGGIEGQTVEFGGMNKYADLPHPFL